MKTFLKSNWIAISLALSFICVEVLHLAFESIPFKSRELPCGHVKVIYYNTPVYYFGLSLVNLYTSLIVFILIDKSIYTKGIKRSSKTIITGVIGWNIIELYQECCYLIKIDEKVLVSNPGLAGQISFVCLLIFLVYYTSAKSRS